LAQHAYRSELRNYQTIVIARIREAILLYYLFIYTDSNVWLPRRKASSQWRKTEFRNSELTALTTQHPYILKFV